MNINQFVIQLAENMEAMEDREIVFWNEPLRNASIRWAIECLANPKCQGSAEAIAAILEKRGALPPALPPALIHPDSVVKPAPVTITPADGDDLRLL